MAWRITKNAVGFVLAIALASAQLSVPGPVAQAYAAEADPHEGLFDVVARRQMLSQPGSAAVRQSCLAIKAEKDWANLEVVEGFSPTAGYGTDRAGSRFAWAVMVLSGRSLAGDMASTRMLRDILNKWAAKGAFSKTEVTHDAYYALKRVLLPTIVAFSVLRPELSEAEEARLRDWIDPLVRRVDQTFNGDVDINNHRYLADSVLMLWGGVVNDTALYEKGRARFASILDEARPDGSLPLETRRGARALWYMRQSLTSMLVMAEVAHSRGEDFYHQADVDSQNGRRSLWTIFSYWLNGIHNPILTNTYAAENYIPGPERDYFTQDMGFLDNRSNGRHYLAFLEILGSRPQQSLTTARALQLLNEDAGNERPLIDEFVGGNATCFWGT